MRALLVLCCWNPLLDIMIPVSGGQKEIILMFIHESGTQANGAFSSWLGTTVPS